MVFGTGKGAGKIIGVMAVVVVGFFVYNLIQKRRA